jgi:hypothetical protein
MTYAGRTIRSYLNLATTTRSSITLRSFCWRECINKLTSLDMGPIVLAILGIATLIVRYKGTGSRLLQVIRRDGGVHYLSLLGGRTLNKRSHAKLNTLDNSDPTCQRNCSRTRVYVSM